MRGQVLTLKGPAVKGISVNASDWHIGVEPKLARKLRARRPKTPAAA